MSEAGPEGAGHPAPAAAGPSAPASPQAPTTARVRVTGPGTGRARRATPVAEIDAQTEVGRLYLRSLMRSQWRLAFGVTAALALTVGALPALFAALPAARHTQVLGLPLAWPVLGLGCYPVLLILAAFYVFRAERHERVFRELVSPRAALEDAVDNKVADAAGARRVPHRGTRASTGAEASAGAAPSGAPARGGREASTRRRAGGGAP